MPAILNNSKNPIFKIYPYTLTYAIFCDENKAQNIYVPGIEEALNDLQEPYKEAILMRFKDGMTYEEMGAAIGRSKERVRQKVAKALRILRHPSRLRKFVAISQSEYVGEMNKLRDQISELENRNEKLAHKLENAGLLSQEDIPEGVKPKFLRDTPIDDLELSVRSYNCLKRAGINTLLELTLLREEDLLNVRNCGHISAEEIITKAKEHGVKFGNPFNNNDIRNLNVDTCLKIRLMKDGITTIDRLTDITVDHMICIEYNSHEIISIDSALSEIGKTFKNNDKVSRTCLSDDLKELLINKGYLTIKQILEVYDEDWKVIIDEHNARELKHYMSTRGTPLKHKSDERYIKTERNPNGNNISDLGITKLTVTVLEAAGINTIEDLTNMTFQQVYETIAKKMATSKYRADIRALMNELVYRFKERNLSFKFTKDMVKRIRILDTNVSFYTKSLLNSVMIYTIGDLLEYKKIDKLKEREGELHEIDKLIHDANELLEKAL